MDTTVSITIADPPEAALKRLEAFGREWRESKLPDDLRKRGYTTSAVSRRGDSVVLTLGPIGRGPAYVLAGRLVASGSGSLLNGQVREARWSHIIVSAFLVLAALALIGIVVSEDGRLDEGLLLPLLIGVMLGARALFVQAGKKAMVPVFAGLVEHVFRPGETAA